MNYVTFIFAIIISSAAFWFSLKFIRLYFRVKRWNRVTATINSKEIFLQPKYSTTRTPYGLKVDYTYQINGIDYKGHNVYLIELSAGQANHMKSDAERRLNNIEPTMSVYVNPNDLTQSVIYCEGIALYIFAFCMGIFALLIGLSKIL